MMKKSKMLRFLSLSAAIAGFLLIAGNVTPASAQNRDPFQKLGWATPKDPNAKKTTVTKDGKVTTVKLPPAAPSPVIPPGIQERINYYKRLREEHVAKNLPIPKVTSVLTLDEMAVIGIFRTPRGYAAMVEAKPINLSYTIYPGEKFFDGQLVAIEENKLIFRRVTKWTNGKFIASEENKSLRQYSVEQEVNGTAPVETTTTAVKPAADPTAPPKTEQQQQQQTPATTAENKSQTAPTSTNTAPAQIISPLDEMARQPEEKPQDPAKSTDKNKKGKQKSAAGGKGKQTEKKPVKVAENKQQ